MDRIHARHSGTLAGQLRPLDQSAPLSVSIVLPLEVATFPACQHTMWMLLNLLARADGIVDEIFVTIPDDVTMPSRVVPLAPRDLDLRSAVLAGTTAISAVPVTAFNGRTETVPFKFVIGPGAPVPDALRVHGERWWGGFSNAEMPGGGMSAIPLGPYAAAALAAAEVFKAVRLESYSPLASVFYSLWSLTVADTPSSELGWTGPADLESTHLEAVVAGVGAVGSTWVHAVWATPGLEGEVFLSDSDELGVDNTNLNRCPIFGRQSIGRRKASEAAAICSDADIHFHPHDDTVGSLDPRRPMTMMVSAVDKNRSRQAAQSLFPARIMSGSTHGLRAEVLRCDPSAETACLRCYNPPEPDGESDEDVRRRFLAMDEDERLEIARERGVNLDEAIQWATEGTCGFAGDEIAAYLRPGARGPEEFAVGFVSVMAGTMLAAISIQETLGGGPLCGIICRAVFQFFDPLNQTTNSPHPYARQAICPMCAPGTPASDIWRRRFSAYN